MAATQRLGHLSVLVSTVLRERALMLATAESCTGGMVASALTDISGSSTWFERGFVTYSNDAKMQMLGVPDSLLRKYGAVSEEVARAMAEGALLNSRAHLALSITGVAGPGGGTPDKPVGMVCFGWTNRIDTRTTTLKFKGDRNQVRTQAAEYALQELLELVRSEG